MQQVVQYLQLEIKDWPVWWSELSRFRKGLPAISALLLWASLLFLGGLRMDHIWMGLGIVALGYGGRSARTALSFLLPLILTGIVYDTQRYYGDYIRAAVHVTEPYNFDKFFFGIQTPIGRLTPNEWWQNHAHPVLDFITGLAYLIFILVYVIQAAYFRFILSRTGSPKMAPSAIAVHSRQIMWAFFIVNVIGYSTYYWYPAAPPWYVSLYGLGPARMDTLASPAGCVRFDELLGTHFFTGMYGRAADVFGAIPSLHVAYPLQGAYYAYRYGVGRTFSICFYLLMCFSAVYLNHHYILDILWGSTYAILVCIVLERLWPGNVR